MEGKKLEESILKTETEANKFNTFKHVKAYTTCNVEVDGISYSIIYDTEHYATQQLLKAEIEKWQAYVYANNNIPDDMQLKDWCRQNSHIKGVRERGNAWSKFIAHSNLVFNLQRPFATTVHKSQGSEFDTVYIAQQDIKKSIRNGYYLNYARLMYVALSRATKKVVII